jgi:mannose-6-phosphate isomerase-like protein (cupin superfamily)
MDAYRLPDLLAARDAAGRLYHEFIRSHDLSVGIYVLAAGAEDPQSPHTEDEVYHVIAGRARLTVGDEVVDVAAGAVVFVPADAPHRFHDITEELVALVVFGPAEYTHRDAHLHGETHTPVVGAR